MLFVGDDWAEDHHDVEIQDENGKRLAKARLPEGIAGITRFHDLIGRFLPEDTEPDQVKIGIETDRGPWVAALVASGYLVYAINPLQSARAREGHGVSGAKSDAGDAHVLADLVRTHSHQLRTVAGDSDEAGAVKVVARMHQTMIWDRTRQMQRLRSSLREFFPAALAAYDDLDAPDALELLAKAPDPASAARLTRAQISAALKRAGRRDRDTKATLLMAALRTEQLGQPPLVTAAYAGTVRALVAVIITLNEQVKALEGQVEACFGRHPDAEIYPSQPGLGASSAPGCSPSSATTPPLRRRPGPQELRRHQPHHPRLRQEKGRPGPLRTQQPPRRCLAPTGVLRPHRLTRGPRLLRRPPGPRHRLQRRPTPARQPPRRHPARLPQNRHPLRRGHRLEPAHPTSRSLTSKLSVFFFFFWVGVVLGGGGESWFPSPWNWSRRI